MKIKLTRPNIEPEIVSIEDIAFISAQVKDRTTWFFYHKSKGDGHSFEILDEENKHTTTFVEGSIPLTQKPMSAIEHLQKVKELIG